jgi:uncharacterized protein (TIGR00725 family)
MANHVKRREAVKTNGSNLNGRSNHNNGRSSNGNGKRSLKGFDSRHSGRPLIAVFGSSRSRRGDELFNQGLKMGRALGASGFNVMTGGYQGVMEAVSEGAHEAGARVLGITMKGFEDRANPYVMDEIHTKDFYARFKWLIDSADGYVAMGGGMGTLAEFTFAWQKISLRMFAERPLVLLGYQWQAILETWAENLTIIPDDYRCLTVAPTPEKACQALRAFFGQKDRARLVALQQHDRLNALQRAEGRRHA